MHNTFTLDPHVIEGLQLFNQGRYFEAHEALEAAWREETGSIRDLYRGILQVAVCYLHITRRNFDGANKMYARSQKYLSPWSDITLGIHVAQLKEDLANTLTELNRLGQSGIELFELSLLKPIAYDKTDLPEKKIKKLNCDRCGSLMVSGECKITCPNCGNRFDCSDLNLYFDELK